MLKSSIGGLKGAKNPAFTYESYESQGGLIEEEVALSKFLSTPACIPSVFSEEECKVIIKMGKIEWKKEPGQINADIGHGYEMEPNDELDVDIRRVTLYNSPAPVPWIMDRILTHILSHNKIMWKFDIKGMLENPTLMQYNAPSGKYDWHFDIGGQDTPAMRKLAYSIKLNTDYEGGEFQIKRSKEGGTPFEDTKIGHMIVNPTYILHRVTEVTKGTRYALVGWVHGPSFR